MNYDIGIQTFWNVPNYGTFAQAYALQRVMQNLNEDKDVRMIAHLDKHHYNMYYNRKAYMRDFPIWKKAFWKSFFVKQNCNTGKEQKFIDAYDLIPHTENIDLNNIKDFTFEKVILGSDIVWDYSIEPFNSDPMLFGIGFKSEINSYAASFGTIPVDAVIPGYVKTAIKNMKYISVRDEKSAEIVRRITGKYPDIVLDPTWLWDFDSDNNIVEPEEKNYIIVYGQDFSDMFIKNLVEYAKGEKKKIVVLDCNNDKYDWCDKLISQADLSPFEWIGYFKYASAVATSTFHGITFSLIFNKRFAFCKSDFIMAKIENFLKEIELYDLYVNCSNDVTMMLEYDFNYSNINQIINEKREQSMSFLRKVCEN